MADDTDFLEGNAPEIPAANPMPRSRAPITPVPAPRRAAASQPADSRVTRPLSVPDSLDREMRLDPLVAPLVDDDLPAATAAKPPRSETEDTYLEDDPLRSPDFPKPRLDMAAEEVSDEDLLPVQRGISPQDSAPTTPSMQARTEELDVPPPVPFRQGAGQRHEAPQIADLVSQDEPPPVPTAKVHPMQVPKSGSTRVETPSLTVDRSPTPASELDMHGGLPDEPIVDEPSADQADLQPKKGFKLPAWLVVMGVLLVAGGGFYMVLPFITKKGETPKVEPSEIDRIVEAAQNDDGSGSDLGLEGDLASEEEPPNPSTQNVGAESDALAVAPAVDTVPPTSISVEPTNVAPNLVPVRLDRYTLTTTMMYRPGAQQAGPVQQMGVFDDGGREIYVAKIMYQPADLQGPSRFLAKVQNLADSSLASSLRKGTAVLNGPSALNNARVPASIYSITESRTDAAGMEMREMKTYMVIDADDGCLIFAVQTPDSDTGYGLTKFIEMSSQLE